MYGKTAAPRLAPAFIGPLTAPSDSPEQTASITEFEACYLERARASLPANGLVETILLGRDPFTESPTREPALAGWWCRPQPAKGVVVLPNPWDERRVISAFESDCWERTSSLVAKLTPILNDIHGVRRPVEYWDLLIAPWLLVTLSEVVDRSLFCTTAHAIAPTARFIVGGAQLVPASTMADAINVQLEEPWNTALLQEIVNALGLPVGRSVIASAVGEDGEVGVPASIPSATRTALNTAAATAVDVTSAAARSVLGTTHGRRLALVGDVKM